MQKKHRAKPALLIIGICLIFSLGSAYANYNTMTEADFLAPGAKLEAGDLPDFLVDKQVHIDFAPTGSFVMDSLEMDRHGLPIPSSFQITAIASPFSVLRC